jgi:hypothetical protein
MAIVAGFDVHRAQITFDALDDETGELSRGRIAADPDAVRRWVERFAGRAVHVAVEACTGWLFVCEALENAGAVAHLAEAGEARALRGPKRRAKTDREDARWLRTLLAEGRLPEAWIPASCAMKGPIAASFRSVSSSRSCARRSPGRGPRRRARRGESLAPRSRTRTGRIGQPPPTPADHHARVARRGPRRPGRQGASRKPAVWPPMASPPAYARGVTCATFVIHSQPARAPDSFAPERRAHAHQRCEDRARPSRGLPRQRSPRHALTPRRGAGRRGHGP